MGLIEIFLDFTNGKDCTPVLSQRSVFPARPINHNSSHEDCCRKIAISGQCLPILRRAQAVDFGGGQASFATGELAYAPEFAVAIAYVAGTIFCFAGILKLKQHAEQPAQVPLSHGLARLATGGALLALPTITSLAQSTLAVGIGTASAASAQTISPTLQ
jgi:hypothetical protein